MATIVMKFGDDVSTDAIYPGRFMATVLPTETPAYAFADEKEFNGRLTKKEIPRGSVLVAGRNFGCGSSREQAVSCLKGHELVIVAQGFARIFRQNAVNLGLRTVAAPGLVAQTGDELELSRDEVVNRTSGQRCRIEPLSATQEAMIEAGGLIPYTRKRLLAT
jgi:3-isopropylmalate/(R)-2-methylmalate dehydratase small subunit